MLDLQEERGLAYMFVTHDLSVVKYISDDIMVMYLGQMVEKAPADDLFRDTRHPYTKALLSAIPVPDIHNKTKRILLRGEITSPINPKPGCASRPDAGTLREMLPNANTRRMLTRAFRRVLQI
jgi:peptide/nickel transport system ATP-binding protein